MAWIQDEAPADRVEWTLVRAKRGIVSASLSSINAGEVFYLLARRHGQDLADDFWSRVTGGMTAIRLVGATNTRIRAAAQIKADQRVSYAGAFAIALSIELAQPLLTGDPEIRRAASALDLELEWIGNGNR